MLIQHTCISMYTCCVPNRRKKNTMASSRCQWRWHERPQGWAEIDHLATMQSYWHILGTNTVKIILYTKKFKIFNRNISTISRIRDQGYITDQQYQEPNLPCRSAPIQRLTNPRHGGRGTVKRLEEGDPSAEEHMQPGKQSTLYWWTKSRTPLYWPSR